MTRRPCPRHPERGDVLWVTWMVTHPVTGEKREEDVPTCMWCLANMKPAGPAEFAS